MGSFTVITPSYNQADYIEQTLQSVLNQNVELQYLVFDGASTDHSVKIIEKYGDQLAYWESKPDDGQSHAINKGLKRANGDIINWLNSDDIYEPNALINVGNNFHSGITGLGGRSSLFNSKGKLSQSRGTDVYKGNVAKTIGWARIDQPETFFSREVWDRVGLLNEKLHYCMDREWWMRYLYTFGLAGFKKIDDVLVNFRIHDDSKTSTSQPGFLKEHHSLYFAMAKAVNHDPALYWMNNSLDLNTTLDTTISSWEDNDLVRRSFNYYLLKSADEQYANGNFELAGGFLKFVQTDLLENEDISLFKKLKNRIPFGPFIKFFK